MSKRILVTGATGTVGSEVAKSLDAAGVPYVVGLRDAHRSAHPSVELDFGQPASFAGALEGVESVFLIAPGFVADADRLLMPFIEAMARSGVKRVVYNSVIGAEHSPEGAHRRIELALEAASIAALTFLRPTFYMQNFITYEGDALFERGVVELPTEEGKASYVDVRDIAAIAAQILVHGGHEGAAYVLTGDEPLSSAQIAEHFTEALGSTVRFTNPSASTYREALLAKGMSPEMADASVELYGMVRDGYLVGVTEEVPRLLGRPATRFDAFAREVGVSALRTRPTSVAPDAATLVSRTNALMTAWEYGDVETYRRLSAPHVRMTIRNYGLDVSGFDSLWGVRTGIKPVDAGPLHIHTADTHVVDGLAVSAQAHVIHRETGQFTQHGVVRFVFDQAGRLAHYHQENTWSS